MLGLGANIAAVTSTDLFTLSNGQSLDLDGTDDHVEIALNNDIINKEKGAISIWMRSDDVTASSAIAITIYNKVEREATSATTNIITLYTPFAVSSGAARALVFYYKSTVDGTAAHHFSSAKKASEFWGKGFSRKAATYNAGGSGFAGENSGYSMVTQLTGAADSGWINLTVTWDTTEVFTPNDATSTSAIISPTEITGAMQVFVNGVKKNKGQSSGASSVSHNTIGATGGMTAIPTSYSFDTIRLGISSSGSSDLDGHVATTAVWSDVLSDDAVAAIYNSGTPIDLTANSGNYDKADNLVGYWPIEEGAGGIVDDKSGNSNNGILVNNAAWAADGFGN